MDLWMDFNLNAEWGLDLMAQPNSQIGDPKDASRHSGDMDPVHKSRDAVQQLNYSPSSEEPLDIEWLESGDLGSLLDALDNGQDRLMTLDDSLFDCSQELALKDNVSLTKSLPTFVYSEVDDIIQGLTPPDSPEQVAPVIKIDPELNNICDVTSVLSPNVIVSPLDLHVAEVSPSDYQNPDIILDELQDLKPDVLENSEVLNFSFTFNDTEQLITTSDDSPNSVSFSCSSDDDSVQLSSCDASPKRSIESIIQSSPELYKVIATPSNLSVRFSPYSKVKGEPKVKGESKSGKSGKGKLSPELELIPEDFIATHLNKKERKKLQNKNAAIRYRQKKKIEVQCIVGEVEELEDRNSDLKTKVDDLQREIKYMKSLMDDIYRAKGLIK